MEIIEVFDKWVGGDENMVIKDKTILKSLAIDQKAEDNKDGITQEIINHRIIRLDE